MADRTSRKAQNIKVIKDLTNPETPEILAKAIVQVAEGFKQLLAQGLTPRAIVTLLLGMDGMRDVKKSDVYLILDNLPKLASYYVKK